MAGKVRQLLLMLWLIAGALFPFAKDNLFDLDMIALIFLLSVGVREVGLGLVHLVLAHSAAVKGLVRKWLGVMVSESPHDMAGVQSTRNRMPAVMLAEESRKRCLLVVGTELGSLRTLLVFLRLSPEGEDLSVAFFFRYEMPLSLLSTRSMRHSHRSAQII